MIFEVKIKYPFSCQAFWDILAFYEFGMLSVMCVTSPGTCRIRSNLVVL